MALTSMMAVVLTAHAQVVAGSLKPVAGELSAQTALTKCVSTLKLFGHSVTGRDAGMRLMAEEGRRVWVIVLGAPSGGRFTFKVNSRSGLLHEFHDNGWFAGMDWQVPVKPKVASESKARIYAASLAAKLGLPPGSTQGRTMFQSGGIGIGDRQSPRVCHAGFHGPKLKHPFRGRHMLSITFVMGTGKVVRVTQAYLEGPLAVEAKIEAAKARSIAETWYGKGSLRISARLLYVVPADLQRTRPGSSRRTVRAWEIAFKDNFVFVDANSGAVLGQTWRHVHS